MGAKPNEGAVSRSCAGVRNGAAADLLKDSVTGVAAATVVLAALDPKAEMLALMVSS